LIDRSNRAVVLASKYRPFDVKRDVRSMARRWYVYLGVGYAAPCLRRNCSSPGYGVLLHKGANLNI
jgi:hypothetical protein